jgi:transglutaminase-like putative cysteine protease
MQRDVGSQVAASEALLAHYFYVAKYVYSDEVLENDNLLRLVPRTDWRQRVTAYRLATSPGGSHATFRDHYGNAAERVRVVEPHRELLIASTGELEITPRYQGVADAPLDALAGDAEAAVFLAPSPLVDPEPLTGVAGRIAPRPALVLDTVARVVAWVNENIDYKRGLTDVTSSAERVLTLGQGVCQDMAHLTLAHLRALGIPGRYVSGLLTGQLGETHAWVEFLHPQEGWLMADPTRNVLVTSGTDYVVFAIGRDYTDVPPVAGDFRSQGTSRIDRVLACAQLRPGAPSPIEAFALLDEAVERPA